MEKLDKALEILRAMERVDEERLRRKVYGTIAKLQRRRRTRTLLRRSVAAAVLLFAGGAVWLYRTSIEPSVNVYATISSQPRRAYSPTLMSRSSQPAFTVVTENPDVAQEIADEPAELQAAVPMTEVLRIYSALTTSNGSICETTLGDGTRVWLNSGSQLRFPTTFVGGERRVWLDGEAFFEVEHDPRRPFIVETLRQHVEVLGTKFNISAYLDEGTVYTTLVDGSVLVKLPTGSSQIVLEPDMQARLDGGTAEFSTSAVDAARLASWRDGVFVFEGVTLEHAMHKIARWYDMEFAFADNAVRDLVLRGSMPVQTDISDVLRLLEASGSVRFTVEGDRIKVEERKFWND